MTVDLTSLGGKGQEMASELVYIKCTVNSKDVIVRGVSGSLTPS